MNRKEIEDLLEDFFGENLVSDVKIERDLDEKPSWISFQYGWWISPDRLRDLVEKFKEKEIHIYDIEISAVRENSLGINLILDKTVYENIQVSQELQD